ncbi:hypothetical protein Hanom_Chr07g00634231 [Helianthus anomalus]
MNLKSYLRIKEILNLHAFDLLLFSNYLTRYGYLRNKCFMTYKTILFAFTHDPKHYSNQLACCR